MIKPHCLYSKTNFVLTKSLKSTTFDRTLLSSWKSAEDSNALNYKICECNLISKLVTVKNCSFIVTLNEKRFTNRRKPQEMTTLNQPFDATKFNFTKIQDKEILMTFGLKKEEQEKDYPNNANVIIVNASPFQAGHSLLVPELDSCHNQVMRKRPLRTALDTLLISGEDNFTVAFNSLMACASVNHLHFHLWNNDKPLISSKLHLDILIKNENCDHIYCMPDHPVYNFVVTFKNLSEIDKNFENLWLIISTLQKLEIPHSICFLKSKDGIRAIIWPRCTENDNILKINKISKPFSVAVAEMAGQIFTGDKEFFETKFDSELLERSFNAIQLSETKLIEVISILRNQFHFN